MITFFKEMEEEFEVLVTEKLIKTTSVFTSNVHTCVDRDYDAATGRYEYSSTVEPDGNLKEVFEQQQRSALKIIECCEKLCAQLLKDGKRIYADIKIADLLSVYDFLRKRKQLGRRQGPFSDEVRCAIIKSLNAKINCKLSR